MGEMALALVALVCAFAGAFAGAMLASRYYGRRREAGMGEWDVRAYEVWRAFVLGVRDHIKVESGLTKEVTEQLLDAGQKSTSGYEVLEMLDWVERKVRPPAS